MQYKQDDRAWTDAPNGTNLTGTSYQLHDLPGGKVADGSKYVFQVRAVTTLQSNTKLTGNWQTSRPVPGLPAGDIATVTATRNANDESLIDVTWDKAARDTEGYDVELRKNHGSWQRKFTGLIPSNQNRSYQQDEAGGAETYTFRVRGVSKASSGPWTESGEVKAPPVRYHGYDAGVDCITLNVSSGPWWYEHRNH